MTEQTQPPTKQDLTEVISIRLNKEQKQFIESNNIAVGEWLRQMVNREIRKAKEVLK